MSIKQTKGSRCLLGALVFPHVWGAGGPWDFAGDGASQYGYGYPAPINTELGFSEYILRIEDYDNVSILKPEYQYPVLIDGARFFYQNWASPEYKEWLETDIRILKWMGIECVRIHILPEKMAEYKEFLKWYLELLRKYNIRGVHLDAVGWDSIPRLASKYKDLITRLGTTPEWASMFSSLQDLVGARSNPELFKKCCKLCNHAYDEAKKVAPNLPIGVTRGDMYNNAMENNTKMVNAFKENKLKFDYWGFDCYPSKYTDINAIVKEIQRIANLLPDKEIIQAELGFHQHQRIELGKCTSKTPLRGNYSTSFFEDVAITWGKQLETIIRKSPIKEITIHYFHGQLLFQFKCFHFCLAPNGEPMPMGLKTREVYKRNLPKDAAINKLDVSIPEVIVKNEKEKIRVVSTNTFSAALSGKVILETPSMFFPYVKNKSFSFNLQSGQKEEFVFGLDIPKELPAGVYHFFARVELEQEAEDNAVYGWGILHKLSKRIDFHEKVSSQIPADTKVIYLNRERLKEFNFIGKDNEPPLIIYGKDYFNGGSQMQVSCGLYLWQSMPFAIGQLPILERYDTFEEGMLETNPLILIGDAKENKWIKKLQESKKLSSIDIGKTKADYEAEHIGTVEVIENAFNNRSAIVISGNNAFGLLWATQDFIESFFRNLRWPMKIFPPTKMTKID